MLSWGWNTTSYQILNPGIEHWFSDSQDAVVGYVRRNGRLVVAGAPVCPPDRLLQTCQAFEDFAERQRCRVCYVCAEDRLHRLIGSSRDHSTVVLGAQPFWKPRVWPEIVRQRSSLRSQINRARNKGVIVAEAPAVDVSQIEGLQCVLEQWLRGRKLPPLHFLVEPDILGGIGRDRIVLTASWGDRVVAWLAASPVVARNGYLIELLARAPDAPNGTSELLIDSAMRRFADEERDLATLGLVALSDTVRDELRPNPWWLKAGMTFARAHANRFYNFRGLERFRLKLAPSRWEPVYAISNEARFSARTLYGVGAAFAGISPLRALAIGAAKALREEAVHFLGAQPPEDGRTSTC